jgi:hypothetical protein
MKPVGANHQVKYTLAILGKLGLHVAGTLSDRPNRIAEDKLRAGNAVLEYLTQGAANDFHVTADPMSEFIAAHLVDDFAVAIDEHRTLHVGARRHNGIVNVHPL